jgi:hypothetical protein
MIKIFPFEWFPQKRFDPHFPLPVWFAGLWLYLKSFLYLCYLYMLGIDPPPYSTAVIIEMVYFGLMMVPALLLALALWHNREKFYWAAVVFLAIDTPFLIFHVIRLSQGGFLDSGLTKVLEFGSLFLNMIALGWLFGFVFSRPIK